MTVAAGRTVTWSGGGGADGGTPQKLSAGWGGAPGRGQPLATLTCPMARNRQRSTRRRPRCARSTPLPGPGPHRRRHRPTRHAGHHRDNAIPTSSPRSRPSTRHRRQLHQHAGHGADISLTRSGCPHPASSSQPRRTATGSSQPWLATLNHRPTEPVLFFYGAEVRALRRGAALAGRSWRCSRFGTFNEVGSCSRPRPQPSPGLSTFTFWKFQLHEQVRHPRVGGALQLAGPDGASGI